MAKLLDPLRSSEARGRVGGVIYNTARGAKYAKVFTSPVQPRTARQLAIRALMQVCTRAWADLAAGERAAWNNYATLHTEIDWTGQPITLSGFNWYCRLSVRLLDEALSVVDTPPAVAAPNAPTTFSAPTGILQSIVTWDVMAGTNLMCEIWTVGPHSAGRVAKLAQAKLNDRTGGELGTATVTGLTPGYWTFFGRTLSEDTGLVSPWQVSTALITAA